VFVKRGSVELLNSEHLVSRATRCNIEIIIDWCTMGHLLFRGPCEPSPAQLFKEQKKWREGGENGTENLRLLVIKWKLEIRSDKIK